MRPRDPGLGDHLQRVAEGRLVLAGKADDDVRREVEAVGEAGPPQERRRVVAPPHGLEDPIVTGLQRDVQVPTDGGRVAKRRNEPLAHVVHLDRGEPEARQTGRGAGLAHEPRQVVARGTIPVAAEVDAGEDDLPVALFHAARDLSQHTVGRAAPRSSPNVRDHAERAREAAAVLHLDEGADAVEASFRLDARDRADIACHGCGSVLAPLRDDDDVVREPGERVLRKIRRAAGDVDAAVRACQARDRLARLRNRLVRHAARADDGDVGVSGALQMSVGKQPLAHRMGVDMRHLATEKSDRERRHGAERYSSASSQTSAAQPSSVARRRPLRPVQR